MRNLRNIGIIAHIDAGKTTLAERFLFYTKEIHRMGEVDDGAATMDYLPEEQERGITIVASCSRCNWEDVTINLIDTPGHVDFTIEVERTLRVLDGAVCVVCATRGVEPQSETVWRQAEKFFLPKVVFVNKMDRLGADFEMAVESLRSRLNANPVPVQMPVFENDVFQGVVDLIALEQLVFDKSDQGRTVIRSPIQGELLDRALAKREQMLEHLADADEDFLELYLNQPVASVGSVGLDAGQIKAAFARATKALRLNPVFLGSALQNIGAQPVLDAVKDYLPSPEEAHLPIALRFNPQNEAADQEEIVLASDPNGPLAVLVFKVVLESGHPLAYARIYSGSLNKGNTCFNTGTAYEEKVNHLYHVYVDDKEAIQFASAGDVVALGGMHDIRTGHTLCSKDFPLLLENISAYSPVISLALEPANSEEGKKLDEALKQYLLEDPTLKLEYDENSGQRIISGMGELHLEILLERLQREYGLTPRSGAPQVVFKETICAEAEIQINVNREVGETIHQGEITLRVSPLQRGSGNKLIFWEDAPSLDALANSLNGGLENAPENRREDRHKDSLKGACKSKNNKNAHSNTNIDHVGRAEVVQALEATLQGGPLGGHNVVDVNVEVLAYARKQGSGLAIAASTALKDALLKAGLAYLEPIMSLEILVPLEAMGDVLNLLASCNAKIIEVTGNEQTEIIRAEAPMRNLFGFATFLRSASKGRAGLTLLFSKFDLWQ